MQPNWAEENLQVIRYLMENSSVYRRTLAPVMAVVGVMGIAAAAIGAGMDLEAARPFISFWISVAIICVFATLLIIRRQALKQLEPFWTPPASRIAQAVFPAYFAGLVLAIVVWYTGPTDQMTVLLLVPIWMTLFGLAMHAAGFFMPRGFRLFGWIFILCGLAAATTVITLVRHDTPLPNIPFANLGMGIFFGAGHLAYSVYLFLTEKRHNVV